MTAALQQSRQSWHSANQQFLTQALAQVRQALLKHSGTKSDLAEPDLETIDGGYTEQPFALELLSRCFGLTEFEKNVLLLCAGMELDGQWSNLCQAAGGSAYPTLGLALSLFENATWGALTPSAALRRYQLIEIGAGNALTASPLRTDERVLHYLTGVQYLDQRLQPLMRSVQASSPLVPSHQSLIDKIEHAWTQSLANSLLPVIQLIGEAGASLRTVALATCRRLSLELQELSAEALPTDWQQLKTLQTLCEREYRLSRMAILLNCEDLEAEGAERRSAIATFI
ncbi:ATP-binding protein, partial [Leptolyngbya cf. ectocarpi LEGE 11479]|nr:ATP-binding protein [Leptolyngbya cf. ectocarpi LEGE 11479]